MRKAFNFYFPEVNQVYNPRTNISEAICEHFGVKHEWLVGVCKRQELMIPRHFLRWLEHHKCGNYLMLERMGRGDHACIQRSVENMPYWVENDPVFRNHWQKLKTKINGYS
jgi:chromosomal replication initiation ATPase DnaA